MTWLLGILLTILVVAIGFLIVSKFPGLGVEVDSFGIAIVAAIVFGVLNGLLGWLVDLLRWTILLVPLAWLLNVIIFSLTAGLVQGFRLRNGIISAVLGALALAIVNQIMFSLLRRAGIAAAIAITGLSVG